MKRELKVLLKEITPPVIWKYLQQFTNYKVSHAGEEPLGDEKPAEYYEQFGSQDHLLLHYSNSHYYPTWLVISDYLLRDKHRAILDLGCGPGQFASLLRDNAFDTYTGIDFSNKRIMQAKNLCPNYTFICKDVFVEGLLESIDYDVVVMTEFLEHIEKDTLVLKKISPGTRIVGTVPSYGGTAHVRKFDTPESVSARYGSLIDNLYVRSVILRERGNLRLQVFDGVRNDS